MNRMALMFRYRGTGVGVPMDAVVSCAFTVRRRAARHNPSAAVVASCGFRRPVLHQHQVPFPCEAATHCTDGGRTLSARLYRPTGLAGRGS